MSSKDLRKEIESLNTRANEERDKKARIKGKMDMLNESLNDLGVTAQTATAEINKLTLSIGKKKEDLDKKIAYFKSKFDGKL